MNEYEENVVEPAAFVQRWRNLLELKENIFRDWRLILAARAINKVSDDEGSMKALASHYVDFVHEPTYKVARKGIKDLGDVIASLRIVEGKFKKKSRALIRANKKAKAFREEVQEQDVLIELLLTKVGQTKEQFIAGMKLREVEVAAANAIIDRALAESQAKIDELERAL